MKKLLKILLIICSCNCLNAQVTFTSTNLPLISINTYGKAIVDEPKITAYMRIIDNGAGIRNSLTDSANVYSGNIGIELRGQSSQQFPKKPYGIETRDAQGNDLDISPFGMPSEADWVLYPSYSDKTLMRNVLAFKLYESFGRYSVRTKFCELFLNGDYIGVYVFMEKIKRDKGRVNIKKLEPADISGDALTGGYIVKIDKPDAGSRQGWTSMFLPPDNSSKRINYLYSYPKEEDITAEQKNYIKQYFDQFENIMNATSFNDPFNGYYNFVNLPTFIDTYILFEFVKNVDSYRISTYFYKDRNSVDGRLCYGPVWDLDFGLGNADYDNGYSPTGWEVFYKNNSDYLTPFWSRKMMNDPVFFNALAKRWSQVKTASFSYPLISAFIDSTVNVINEAKTRNFQKWNILGKYVWPNPYIGANYSDEITYFKNWIQQRTNWINQMLTDNFTDVTWYSPDASQLSVKTGVKKGIPVSNIFKIIKNADSVHFVSSSGNVSLNSVKDTLFITTYEAGTYKIKGLAYRSNAVYDISPEYTITSAGVLSVNDKAMPSDYKIHQNYPNPFNPSTNLSIKINSTIQLSIKVYDVLGREAAVIFQGKKDPGSYSFAFDASMLPAGTYFCRFQTGERSEIIKMLYLK